jgi:hypothetical protein
MALATGLKLQLAGHERDDRNTQIRTMKGTRS